LGAANSEADTTLESDYILLHTLLGTGDPERFRKAANWIVQHQNEDGGWSIYASGPSNIRASVKAYFGYKARRILRRSSRPPARPQKNPRTRGVTEVNTFTKIYLCFLRTIRLRRCPRHSPESFSFPTGFWFNIYEICLVVGAPFSSRPFHLPTPRSRSRKNPARNGASKIIRRRHDEIPHCTCIWSKKLVSWTPIFLPLSRSPHPLV